MIAQVLHIPPSEQEAMSVERFYAAVTYVQNWLQQQQQEGDDE